MTVSIASPAGRRTTGPLAVALTPIVSDTARLRFRSRWAPVTGSIAAIGSPPAPIDA
ncbi:hypothetical protein [Sphingomonas yabuuchiae]|uniref:hypothetical protein n=1 Tax=Sphingomonas yabuuchiae TaxID=172044 RepID=UPI0019D276C6|nr:hypothetical protein [Sphingomonas yabuuchiae]